MKTILTSVFLSLVLLAQGQTPDTSAVRLEIDSLIQLNDSLVEIQKFDEALEVLNQAEEKCLESFGKEKALYATIINQIGVVHYYKGDYNTTESFWLKTEKIRKRILGKEHPQYASILNNLGSLYWDMGQYEKVESFFLEAKEIREKVLGEDHPHYAMSLTSLGNLYCDIGQYENAEAFYLEAKVIQERVLGREHPDYASILNNLGILYKYMGKPEKVEAFYLEAKEIWGKVLGKEHPNYAMSLNNLGLLYRDMGEYENAETLYLETKVITEKMLGKEHPNYATTINNMGILYSDMAQYKKAETFYLEAKVIREKIFGKEHPDYAKSLNNLGVLYYDMGQYEKAETFYLETKAIREKIFGKEHPDYAKSLNNLGILYMDVGQYEKAETLYLEAKEIRKKVLGDEHLEFAMSLNNLGVLYKGIGQYKKAETFFLEAKVIAEKLLGREHPDYAKSLNNLGNLYTDMGEYEKAETFFLETKAIWKKSLGNEHPDYATSLNNMGALYLDMGKPEKVEAFYLEAKEIREKVLGREHPDYAMSLINLGNLYWKIGEYEKAETFFLEANEIRKQHISKATQYLSERDLLSYTTTFISYQNQFISFANKQEAMAGSAYNHSLFYKGFLLTASQQVSRLAQTDSMSNELFLSLKSYNRRLSKEYSNPIAKRDSIAIANLEEKANQLEKELVRTVAGFGEALRQVNWQEVQAVLKPGEVAIEFAHYNFHNPDPTDSIMYAALILRQEDKQPQLIPLFEEKSLNALLALHQERRSDYVNDLYAIEDRGAAIQQESKQSLYELIWAPMEAQLEGITKVYFSPSGLLHRINLAAIPIGEEQSLCDNYNLVQVNSTRQLVIPDENISSTSNALLMGGIEYNIDSTAIFPESEDPLLSESLASRGESSFINLDSTLRGGSWNFLKYTEKEVVAIDRLFSTTGTQAETYTGLTATEDLFRQSGREKTSPSIIHLATHGFFFPDPVNNKKQSAIGDEEPIFKTSDHPMVRSGLILAGGNHVWQGKTAVPGIEDGILTAYEISQMDLSNTELVVLSACETGLGDIEGNEGVYGLQRAFKIAGAKYLIMSLWQVPDRETKDFMVQFYKHLINEDMTIPDAFRITQKEMKERFYNPHQWAGFILVE